MNEFMLYTLTYLFSQALGIYSIYKLVRAFFEECIVKRCVEVGAFVGYYVLTSSLYLIVNYSKFCSEYYIGFLADVYVFLID